MNLNKIDNKRISIKNERDGTIKTTTDFIYIKNF